MAQLDGIVRFLGTVSPWVFVGLLIGVVTFRIVLVRLPDKRRTPEEPLPLLKRFLKRFVEYIGNVTLPEALTRWRVPARRSAKS